MFFVLAAGGACAGCGGDDTTDPNTRYSVTVNAVYPTGAVTAGHRPSVAVYAAADYNDFSQRPDAMPIAALVGEEQAETISGPILDLLQTEVYRFPPGSYAVVFGVAEATGMPSHVEGTVWHPVAVEITDQDVSVDCTTDIDWRQ
jgi:hypothetical protein